MTDRLPPALKRLLSRRQGFAALVLVAAIAAMPFLLRDDAPAASTPAAVAAVDPDEVGEPAPVVSRTERADAARTIGSKRDPFKADKKATEKPASPATSASASTAGTPATSSVGTTTPSLGGGGRSTPRESTAVPTPAATAAPMATATPAPAAVPATTARDHVWIPVVRRGFTDGELRTGGVARLTAFPSKQPLAQLVGLRRDHSAVFVVPAGVTVTGAGACAPATDDCQRLALRPGGAAFLARDGREYRLELLQVRRRTVDATTAERFRAATAHDGRDTLRGLLDRVGGLRYDAATGTVG